MLFEFINAVLTLDFEWLAGLVFSNFHWLFAFAAMMFFFFEGKTKLVIGNFFFFCILAWAFVDFETTSGWLFFVGGFLALNYLVKIASLTFAQADPKLSKHLLIVNFVAFYILWTIYNIFLVGAG